MKKTVLFLVLLANCAHAYLFVPMDDTQANHLKSYGLAYRAIQSGVQVKWLLNYRGGSFLIMSDSAALSDWAVTRNITFEKIGDAGKNEIDAKIESENMASVNLDSAPRVAIYAPPWNAPWDDAVTLALQYAEIPYTTIWDEEVMGGLLSTDNYDWLHLHHEDFTGQHGKFWFGYAQENWYVERVLFFDKMASRLGYRTTQEEKKAVAVKIRDYVKSGGFLFAMCAATDTLDIALSSIGIDIIPEQIDGTPCDETADSRLDFSGTFAFENFRLVYSPYIYEFSDIDLDTTKENINFEPFYISLNEFSAKYDVIPCMLNQNHKNLIKGFLGQTTGFHLSKVRKEVTLLDTVEGRDWATYIHGDCGKGTYTFLGGHDPEDYSHRVGEPPTNLDLFPNSPGYRLILNNILFPAAKMKKKKT